MSRVNRVNYGIRGGFWGLGRERVLTRLSAHMGADKELYSRVGKLYNILY